MAGDGAAGAAARARRRFCSSSANHARRWPAVIGGLIRFILGSGLGIGGLRLLRRRRDRRRFNQWLCGHWLNRPGSNRRHVSHNERTPLAPNDWKHFVHRWQVRLKRRWLQTEWLGGKIHGQLAGTLETFRGLSGQTKLNRQNENYHRAQTHGRYLSSAVACRRFRCWRGLLPVHVALLATFAGKVILALGRSRLSG